MSEWNVDSTAQLHGQRIRGCGDRRGAGEQRIECMRRTEQGLHKRARAMIAIDRFAESRNVAGITWAGHKGNLAKVNAILDIGGVLTGHIDRETDAFPSRERGVDLTALRPE